MKSNLYDLSAEMYVLRAIITHPAKFQEVKSHLTVECFNGAQNKSIWRAICAIIVKGESLTVSRLWEQLRQDPQYKWTYKLFEVYGYPSPFTDLKVHISIVRRLWEKRFLIQTASAISNQESPSPLSVMKLNIEQVSDGMIGKTHKGHAELSEQALDRLVGFREAQLSGDLEKLFIAVGLSGFDREMLILERKFVIIAARPAMGKTALMKTLAIGINSDTPILINTLEIPEMDLLTQMAAAIAEIELDRVESGKVSNEEIQRLAQALDKLSHITIIHETDLLDFELAFRTWRQQFSEDKRCIVMVDYLQLISIRNFRRNKEQETATISKTIMGWKHKSNNTMIVLSQLSRSVEMRGGDKKPNMSDLRDSGQIEQDADLILFPYRPEYYGFETDEEGRPTLGRCDVLIGKRRGKHIPSVNLQLIHRFGKMTDWEWNEGDEFDGAGDHYDSQASHAITMPQHKEKWNQ
jgi:replicative DNA helicase